MSCPSDKNDSCKQMSGPATGGKSADDARFEKYRLDGWFFPMDGGFPQDWNVPDWIGFLVGTSYNR